MCQRVLIAMAFASEPALIVADEPTTALDVSTQAHIVQIIRSMQRDHGTALLFITHDLRLAAHVCDDILVLYAGEMVERGPARAVSHAPRHPYTRALQAANPPLGGSVRTLVTLPDQMPGIGAFAGLPGCRFAPRCPVGDKACASVVPTLREIAPGHAVRCSDGCLEGAARVIEAAPLQSAAPPPGDVVLTLNRVSKHYAGERDWLGRRRPGTDAVKPMDLTVRAGEFVGIVGESGSGKSTVAKLVMGLEPLTTGSIAIDGKDVSVNDPAARSVRLGTLQMVFQDPQSALNPRRPVGRLITQSLEASGSHASEAERRRPRPCAAHRNGPAARSARPLPLAAFRRTEAARQHRAGAVRHAPAARRGRDRLGARRVGAGADPEPAAEAARRARHRPRLHLARPRGGALSLPARARHAARRGG